MAFFPTNQFLLFIFTTSFLLLVTEFVNSDETVSFDLADYISGEKTLTLQGNAVIQETHLELTGDINPYTIIGRALYPTPVPIWDSATGNVASFVTSFSFSLVPFGSYPRADGLIFFLAPPNSVIPNVNKTQGGDLGVVDDTTAFNRFVGVEFDNFHNDWDPNNAHIGIDVNSLISSKTSPWESQNGVLYNVTIIYDSSSRTLSVSLIDELGQVATVAQAVDLKDVLPETVSIGLSGATSLNCRQIYVIETWSFKSILKTTISSNILENTNHTSI